MSDELAAAQRGSIFLEQGRFAEAERYFREALSFDPNNATTLFQLGFCLYQLDQHQEALTAVNQSIGLQPLAENSFALKALLLSSLNRVKEAHVAAQEAIQLNPTSDFAFSAQALIYSRENRWREAEVSAREALRLNPESHPAASTLAHVLRKQNRLEESSAQIAYMLGKDPEDASNHTNAGWNALQKGDLKQAEKHFLEALRLDAMSESAREGLKEAFKARSPLYRAYLSYCFFMQRFTSGRQWMLIVGFMVISRVAGTIFVGRLAIIGLIFIILYLLFVLWVHVARGVGNLQLVFDRFARHALTRGECLDAVVVGGSVTLGLLLLLTGFILGNEVLLPIGITLIGIAFPFSHTFTNPSPLGRIVFGLCGLLVLVVGTIYTLTKVNLHLIPDLWLTSWVTSAFFTVVAVTWLANVPALKRK